MSRGRSLVRTPSRSRSRSRTPNGVLSSALRAASTMHSIYSASMRSRSSSRNASSFRTDGTNSGGTVTFQNDSKVQYKRKRKSRKSRKSWKKFSSKVKAVEAAGRGKQQLVINEAINSPVTETNPRTQGISEVNLYSVNADVVGGRDKDNILNEISNYRTFMDVTGSERPNFDLDRENELSRIPVRMHGASIDISYTNTGDNVLEVDLYTLKHRRTQAIIGGSVTGIPSLEAAQTIYNQSVGERLYEHNKLSGVVAGRSEWGAEVRLNFRGVSPFQTPGLMKYTGATILNKTKILISPGNTVTRRYSNNKHMTIYPHTQDDKHRYDKDTTTYLALIKPRAAGGFNNLQTSYTKNYSWTVEGMKTPRASYLTTNT